QRERPLTHAVPTTLNRAPSLRASGERVAECAARSAQNSASVCIQLLNSQASSPPGLVGLGVCPSLFPFPQTRGRGAPEQTPEDGPRLPSAPRAFPAFASHGARTRASP